MNFITTYLFDSKKQTKEISWFRNALLLFLSYKVIVYSLKFKELFSIERLIFHNKQTSGIINDFAYFLTQYYSVWLGATSILLLALLAVIGLLKKANYMTNVVLWLLVININNFLYPTLTAGDFLTNQLLFFNIFFLPKISNNVGFNEFKTALHNVALIGIKVQVCLVYFLAAWFKLTDDSWLHGEAVYQTFQIPEYSNAFLSILPMGVCVLLTYATIIYQLLFPLLIWIRPAKIYLLSFGVLQHLLIAFGMGLSSFGIIMIICYILFFKYDYKS